jgi:hypothetical protein
MLTANEWIRQQESWDRAIEQHTQIVAEDAHGASILNTNAFLEQSSIYRLIEAIILRDKNPHLNFDYVFQQAQGLVNARARTARVRILNHAFRQLCEVWG